MTGIGLFWPTTVSAIVFLTMVDATTSTIASFVLKVVDITPSDLGRRITHGVTCALL